MREHINKAVELVALQLPAELYLHTVRTRDYALELAKSFACDREETARVELAALLHDNCKHWQTKRLLAEAQVLGYEPGAIELQVPALLHAKVGAHRLRRDFAVFDEVVYSAVYHHTAGGPGMHRVARIIYCADKLEPGREYEGVAELRARAAEGLAELCLAVIGSGLAYVQQKHSLIDPVTVNFHNELVENLRDSG